MSLFRLFVSAAVLLFGRAEQLNAGVLTFTKIADTSGSLAHIAGAAVNDSGTVAFVAAGDDFFSDIAVYTATSSASPTNIGTVGAGSTNFHAARPSINSPGTVAFRSADHVIYTSSGGVLTRVVDQFDPEFFTGFPVKKLTRPVINDAGSVAFGVQTGGFNHLNAVYTSLGGSLTKIIDDGSPHRLDKLHGLDISNSGTVVLGARDSFGQFGIYSGNGGGVTREVLAQGTASVVFPGINSSDNIAFRYGQGSFQSILTRAADGNGPVVPFDFSTLNTFVDTNGPFSGFGSPVINDSGTVLFYGSLDAGGEGLFLGPDPTTDRLVLVGDELMGKTVAALSHDEDALNNHGQVAFSVTFTDNSKAVFLTGNSNSAVPEPRAFAVLGIAVMGLMLAAATTRRSRGKPVH